MKKILSGLFALWLMSTGVAQGQTKTVQLYIAPNSTVAVPDIMKNLVSKCPNTTITLDPLKSDFMLQAWGWSGNYKFTVFQRGGTAIYGTTTVALSNAVKDVCHFLQSPQAQLSIGPDTPYREATSAPSNSSQAVNVRASSLNKVSNALTNAADNLRKAANQSDYVQEAIAKIDQALDDAKQAAAHVHTIPVRRFP